MGNSISQLAIAYLAKHGVCWGEFRVSDMEEIFQFERTSPGRAYYILNHIDDLIKEKYQTFVIIFANEQECYPSVMENDIDYVITNKTVGLSLLGDCYVHNMTKGIFLIESSFTNDQLYSMYKLSINGLNNFAYRHKNRCFSKTSWFKKYLDGNVFVLDYDKEETMHQIIQQNHELTKLQAVMLAKHYKEAGFCFDDLLNFLKRNKNKINS